MSKWKYRIYSDEENLVRLVSYSRAGFLYPEERVLCGKFSYEPVSEEHNGIHGQIVQNIIAVLIRERY